MNHRYGLLEKELMRKINDLETLEGLYKEILEKHSPLKHNIENARIELMTALHYMRAYQDEADRKRETNP